MRIEQINYQGWNCCRASNEIVDAIATLDVGPRIIRFGFVGEANEFKEYADQLGKTGGDEWRIYGGHRLWHAPEVLPRTYAPDNSPIKFETLGDGIKLIQPVERTTGIAKEIELHLAPNAASARVVQRLTNHNVWAVEFAPWALSVMAQGGKAILPLPRRGEHPADLQAANRLVLWHFTDMSDPRWTWGNKYILLRQDATMSRPQKLGASVPDGWCAHARDGHLFVKRTAFQSDAQYTDLGCSVETFTNADMLELETLGPLTRLEPGATVEHVETWQLFRDVPVPMNDADVDAFVLPKIKL
ncbi:MAG: hypothetical protein HY868_25060 [Chloroflexi bacterium]|nr:hypothetical protein [Chloroflexota bacterium]